MNFQTPVDVLIIDDDVASASVISALLVSHGYRSGYSLNLRDAMSRVKAGCPRLVLLDLSLPDGKGIDVIAQLKRLGVLEIIVISAIDSPEHTRQCLGSGAFDFIVKPAESAIILSSVQRADRVLRFEQVKPGTHPYLLTPGIGSLEGRSAASVAMFKQIRKVAQKLHPGGCLILGPAGVLKNDIAASVVSHSPGTGSARLINCAGESDEFIMRRFKGEAVKGEVLNQGYIHQAENGALVLDDLTALQMDVQVVLAEYLLSLEFTPVNSTSPETGSCSIIGVLREDPREAVMQGRLDAGLYGLLSQNIIEVPGLKQRESDIGIFAEHAVRQLNSVFDTEKGLSDVFMNELYTHSWPGNLVEFRNLILMGYRLTEPGEEIGTASLLFSDDGSKLDPRIAPFIGMSLRESEQQLIEATLAHYDHNKRTVASVLGISVKTLYNRLKSYEKRQLEIQS